VKKDREEIVESGPCDGEGCRHQAALKDLKASVRKVYHDLCQPLMVVQGYLELFELNKIDNDMESVEQIMAAVSTQLGALQEIQRRLMEAIKPKQMNTVKNGIMEGK
jgi:signal transduction histidine kinase